MQEMELLCNSDIDLNEWKEFILSSEYSSPFQTPEFYNLYNSVQGQSAEVFSVRDKDSLVALCVVTVQKESGLKGFFSKRGIIYGGPLIARNNNVAVRYLLKRVKEKLRSKVIYIEIRNLFSYMDYKKDLRQEGWDYIPYLNSEIDLKQKTPDSLLSSMKYNRRREISQSLKSGAIYRLANSESDVKNLYIILQDLYSTKVKLPLPSINYFIKLFNSEIGKVFVVEHNNKIIGGSFCYYLKRRSIYTLYYCGLRDYDKKFFPTHLAILAALDFGVNQNLTSLDLMGAGKPGKEYGVRQYKLEFGGSRIEYGRFLLINSILLYKLGIFTLNIKKIIKL